MARGWRDGRVWLLVGTLVAGAVGLATWSPIPQDPAYHHLADEPELPRPPQLPERPLQTRRSWPSGWPGWPSWPAGPPAPPARLSWTPSSGGPTSCLRRGLSDRLRLRLLPRRPRQPHPVLGPAPAGPGLPGPPGCRGERAGRRPGRALAPTAPGRPGVLSVVLWRAGEAAGHGDLRLYGLVQFYPMLAIPLMLLLFPPRYTRTADLWGVVAWYAGAKVFEALDHQSLRPGPPGERPHRQAPPVGRRSGGHPRPPPPPAACEPRDLGPAENPALGRRPVPPAKELRPATRRTSPTPTASKMGRG